MRTLKQLLALLLCCLISDASAQQGAAIGANAGLPAPTTITVTVTPTLIGVGGTATVVAVSSPAGAVQTGSCTWSSSSPTIASFGNPAIPYGSNVVTGNSTGTVTLICNVGAFSGQTTLTVSSAPIITNPQCVVQPCMLPSGTVGTAYSGTGYTFMETGGGSTWGCSVTCSGVLPPGLSLNASTGVLSGTPTTTGTYTPTITYGAAQVQVSITINSGGCSGGGGPPSYPCSSQTIGFNPGVAPNPISSTTSDGTKATATTCKGLGTGGAGCQNTVFYDSTINGASVDAQTRITDGSVSGSSGGSVDNNTCSGGSNDNNIGDDGGTNFYVAPSIGGATRVYHVGLNGSVPNQYLQVVNAGVVPAISIPCPNLISKIQATGGTSAATWVGPTTAYYLSSGVLYVEQWNSDATVLINGPTQLVNFVTQCPGIPTGFVANGSSQINVAGTGETIFNTALSNYSNQGSATILVSYNRATNQCASTNMVTGQYFAYCTVGTHNCNSNQFPAGTLGTGTDTCWGIPVWSGTVSVTNGSPTVNLVSGNSFTFTNLAFIYINGNTSPYSISSVNSTSQITLGKNFTGASGTYSYYVNVGIHNVQSSGDGTMWVASFGASGGWTQGTCAGSTNSTQLSFITVGSATTQYVNGTSTYNFDSHQSIGISNSLSPLGNYDCLTVRPNSSVGTLPAGCFWTGYQLGATTINDWHGTWLHYDGADDLPWLFATDNMLVGSGSGCSVSAVYCPAYGQNVLAGFLNTSANCSPTCSGIVVFTHVWSCGTPANANCTSATYSAITGADNTFAGQFTIPSSAPTGRISCYVTSMLGNLGPDKTGLMRDDLVCLVVQ